MDKHIITEDGVHLEEGDHAYNYYDMKPGVISKVDDHFQSRQDGDHKEGLWFQFKHDNGEGMAILNGARICSDAYAKHRGFRDAA